MSDHRFRAMGITINTDGLTNSIVIPANSPYLRLENSATYNDIRRLHVLLYDGKQFAPNAMFDYRSISDYIKF